MLRRESASSHHHHDPVFWAPAVLDIASEEVAGSILGRQEVVGYRPKSNLLV